MASFDKAIPPGGEGKITVTVNTKGYEGNIHKTAVAHSNDPNRPIIELGVKAFVRVSLFVSPRYVYLREQDGRAATKTVKIEASLEKPLIIEPEKFDLTGKVIYEITETIKNRSYEIHFTSIPGNQGMVAGSLVLKTNYEEIPVINIRIRARFKEEKANQGK